MYEFYESGRNKKLFSSSRIIKSSSSGHMPFDGIITHCLITEHIDKKIYNQRTDNPGRKSKKTEGEKPKKTRKIESKDKPGFRSLTKNNLRTQTSNCNSPYKCNGFNENWFPQSYDIDLKLSLVLMISIFI